MRHQSTHQSAFLKASERFDKNYKNTAKTAPTLWQKSPRYAIPNIGNITNINNSAASIAVDRQSASMSFKTLPEIDPGDEDFARGYKLIAASALAPMPSVEDAMKLPSKKFQTEAFRAVRHSHGECWAYGCGFARWVESLHLHQPIGLIPGPPLGPGRHVLLLDEGGRRVFVVRSVKKPVGGVIAHLPIAFEED